MSESAFISVCVLCGVTDDKPVAVLGENGCQGLIQTSKLKGEDLHVAPAQEQENPLKKNLFEKCLFCGTNAKFSFLTRKEILMFSLLGSGYQILKQFQVEEHEMEVKRRRPSSISADRAFQMVLQHFESNDTEQLTINDLVVQMELLCGEDAYRSVYMKKKILDYFGGSVIITELNGKANVVTYKSEAHSILHNFYKRREHGDSESEKNAIIKTAAKLIMNDIRSMEFDKTEYPSSAHIMSIDGNRKFVPDSLQVFLKQLINNKNSERLITSLGQAISQAALPRSAICPLQLGLGVQLHHQYGSRFLIETLNSLGVCSSYQEIQRFETSAAIPKSISYTDRTISLYSSLVTMLITILEHYMVIIRFMAWALSQL
ncbi:uncharacterized protein LOC128211218 [Mya arenaria]|uniref:uncharacterized protein LOC128211218 n=1 Tax=Mya arenaria TaxID=6604 RepID=UPI0022E0FF25|nr:uncharacterized protein LOC128211218 [Mya arenaria]